VNPHHYYDDVQNCFQPAAVSKQQTVMGMNNAQEDTSESERQLLKQFAIQLRQRQS